MAQNKSLRELFLEYKQAKTQEEKTQLRTEISVRGGRFVTEHEYNELHTDYRGVWTTERDDLPNWEEERKHHIGKRTMMVYPCTLLIEDSHFIIE